MNLVVAVYEAAKCFPREETYGLTIQLRRAVVSIPSNIAEGHGRRTPKEFRKFLLIAYGSLREVETQLLIAQRLDYLDFRVLNRLMKLAGEVGALLNGLTKAIGTRAG